jgi:hypothetical protein
MCLNGASALVWSCLLLSNPARFCLVLFSPVLSCLVLSDLLGPVCSCLLLFCFVCS